MYLKWVLCAITQCLQKGIQSINNQFTLWIKLSHAIWVTIDMNYCMAHLLKRKVSIAVHFPLFINCSVSVFKMPASLLLRQYKPFDNLLHNQSASHIGIIVNIRISMWQNILIKMLIILVTFSLLNVVTYHPHSLSYIFIIYKFDTS